MFKLDYSIYLFETMNTFALKDEAEKSHVSVQRVQNFQVDNSLKIYIQHFRDPQDCRNVIS